MESSLVFELQADELELFLQEVNEHLRVIETGILRLGEKRGVTDPETLDAVFRAAHTLKAVAATAGHHEMAELAHTIETLFERTREGAFTLTPAVVEELLVTVDVLETLSDEVVSLQPGDVDTASALSLLRTLTEDDEGDDEPSAAREEVEKGFSHPLTPEQAAQAQDYDP